MRLGVVMAYKKFIKRGGNVYGPYVYKSRKENGKVITEYLGKPAIKSSGKTRTKKIPIVLSILGLIAVLSLVIFFNSNLTGKVALQVQENYLAGEQVQGNLELSLKHGELIPAGTKILIENGGEISEFLLSDLISGNIAEGNFYAEGTSISGEGQGYGIIGKKKIYPDVYFELQIVGKGMEQIETEATEKIPQQQFNETETEPTATEETKETPVGSESETPGVETSTEKEKGSESPNAQSASENAEATSSSEPSTESSSSESGSSENSAGITGEIVNENNIEGKVSKDNPFNYELPEKKSAKIKKGSIRTDVKELSESDINLKVSDSVAVVTTNYYETEQGFGEDYLTDEKVNFNIDLSQFGLTAKQGQLLIRLVYSDTLRGTSEEISSVSKNINVEGEIPEQNITEIFNETIPEIPVTNVTIPEQNLTATPTINVSVIENLTSLQYKAIAGRPVKWIKIIKTTNETDLVEIPKKSNNITIKTGDEVQQALDELAAYENTVDNADRNQMADGTLTGMVSLDINENKGFLRKLIEWFSKFGLTGNVIQESEMQDSIIETNDNRIVEVDKIVNATDGTDVAIEYYTEPSTVVEENLTNGKRITISADDSFNYTDILTYSLIDKNISMQDLNKIRLYWDNNSTREKTNFTAYDLDSNGDVDYIEWVVPHLSVQVYEIIYITKAEHLDANRTFVSDIYDSVKNLDGVWSETINDSEYVRVTFEQMLDNTKDITIYARGSEGSSIGVYTKDSNELLTTFENVVGESQYKIYLTKLVGNHDVFDLKVSGAVEFDYIVDPSVTFTNTASWNGTFVNTNLTEAGANVSLNRTVETRLSQNLTGAGVTCANYNNAYGFASSYYGSACDANWNITDVFYLNYAKVNGWMSNLNTVNEWIAYNFSNTPMFLTTMRIAGGHINTASRGPQYIMVQASNDAITWTNITNTLTATNGDGATLDSFTINSATAYKYYRVFMNNNYGGNRLAVSSLQFEGNYYHTNGSYLQSVDAGTVVVWNNVSWHNVSVAGTTLNLKVRSCPNVCAGVDVWEGVQNTSASNFTSSPAYLNTSITPNNRYFQINVSFVTTDTSLTPVLEDLTVEWSSANSAPSVPNLNQPLNATNLTTTTTAALSWSNSTDSDGNQINYSLEVDNNFDFSSITYSNYTIKATANTTGDTATGLSAGTTYYWRVLAMDGTANSSWSSPIREFTTNNIPSVPNLNQPLNATNWSFIPPLNWSNSTDADGNQINYSLQVDNNFDFSSVTYSNYTIKATANTTGDTPTGLTDAKYYWRVLAMDGTSNSSWSSPIREFTIDTLKPAVNITSPLNATNTTDSGIDINVTVNDSGVGLNTCWFTNNTGITNITFTCGSNLTTYTWIEGINNLTIWANDSVNNVNSSSVSFVVDTTYPIFSTYAVYPANNTAYTSGGIKEFNVTLSSTNGSVGLEFKGVNYTGTNMTATLFNRTISGLSAGNYSYKWWGYGSGALNNFNVSEIKHYTIANSTDNCDIQFNATSPLIYPTSFKVYTNCTYDFNITRDGIIVANNSEQSLGAGTYNFTVTRNDTANYTNRIDSELFTISQYTQTFTPLLNGATANLTITYPQQFNASFSGTNYTFLNISIISPINASLTKGINYTYGVRNYTINYSLTSNQNYTGLEYILYVNISEGTGSTQTWINGARANTTGIVNQTYWVNATRVASDGNMSLYVNGTIVNSSFTGNLANYFNFTNVSYVNITAILSASTNYTGSSETWWINITADSIYPIFSSYSTNPANNTAYSPNACYEFNVTITNTNSSVTFTFNSTSYKPSNSTSGVYNYSICNLGANTNYIYNWTSYGNGTSNNLNVSGNRYYTISQYTQTFTPLLNGATQNLTITYPQQFNASFSGTNYTFLNISIISPINASLTKGTNYTYGVRNYTINYSLTSNQNYTGLEYILYVNISEGTGNVAGYIGGTGANRSVDTQTTTMNFSANRLAGETTISLNLNGTTLTGTTWVSNNTPIGVGTYQMNVSIGASENYTADSESWTLIVTQYVAPTTTATTTTSGGGGGGSAAVTSDFKLGSGSYETTLSNDKTESANIKLTNTENAERTFLISQTSLGGIIFINNNTIKLGPRESTNIEFTILAPSEPGLYAGKIIVATGTTKKEILVSVNVNSGKSLYDIIVTIPKELKTISLGENLEAQIDLLQAGLKKSMDVTLNYIIKDYDGNIYLKESETIQVYDKKTHTKEFHTAELVEGNYVLGVELIYPDGVAVASSQFRIGENLFITRERIVLAGLIFAFLIVVMLAWLTVKKYMEGLKKRKNRKI